MPERRCLACGGRRAKPELARFVVVRTDGGAVLARDDRAVHGGRGLYVCRSRECFERAVARRGFHRGARLGGELTIDPELGAAVGTEGQWGT